MIKQLKSICEEAAMNSTTNSINVDKNVDASINFDPAEASVIELTCPESMPGISNQLNLTAPMPFNNEQTFIKDKLSCIEAEMKLLESKFLDKTLSLANDLNNLKEHCLENNSGYINGLQHENISLKEENKTLKDRLEKTRFALADLNTKVKDLENEKACLITSLKILYQDYFQSDENGFNNKESAASSSAVNSGPWLKPSSTCKSSKTVDSNIQISNRFESLDCEGDVEESDDPETLNNTPTKDQNKLRTNVGKKRKGGAKGHGTHSNMNAKKLLSNSQQKNQEQKQDVDNEGNSIENKKKQEAKKSKKTKETHKPDEELLSEGHHGRETVVVAGDSIVKFVKGWELSNAGRNDSVKSFSGATLNDMSDFLKPTGRKQPDKLIIHAGTNDLRRLNPNEVADRIVELAENFKKDCTHSEVVISSLVTRCDGEDVDGKVNEANTVLKSNCVKSNLAFLDNSNINRSHLNSRELHLNRNGTSVLQANILNFLNSHN